MQNIAVSLLLNEHTLMGYIQLPQGQRLSDFLNHVPEGQADTGDTFVTLTDVTMKLADGTKGRVKTVYINKQSIRMIMTIDNNAGRGIGAQEGQKQHPFVPKSPVRANIQLPGYEVVGYMHCEDEQDLTDLVNSGLAFIPCTNTMVHDFHENTWWKADFVTVNRNQILCFRRDEQGEYIPKSPYSPSNN